MSASGDVTQTESQYQNMVFIPAGSFIMGDDRFPREAPRREMSTSGFWMDKYLVTNQQYLEFAEQTGSEMPAHWIDGKFPVGHANHPAEVSWVMADAYARHVGKRLPTEAEWEKAARGTDGLLYPWGDDFRADHCLTWETSSVTGAHSEPVDARPQGASPYGCEQMVGLCEEWCADEYDGYPESNHYSVGYGKGMRVLRGGSWIFPVTHARASYRCFEEPFLDTIGFGQLGGPGFRCALDEESR
jgi:formylglycine-generating enzyme required for sulfatase activity